MKILCNFSPCGPSFVRSGWGRAFNACGHEFTFWNTGKTSAFDVFSIVEPDLYIGTTYEIDRAVYKNIMARPNMKVILFASAWGTYVKDIKHPIVLAGEEEKKTLEKLKKETGKPDFVFIHAHDKWLDGTMSGWKSIGIDYKSVMNAADTFIYLNSKVRPELECDIGFVGGYWGYKARNLDRILLPICHPSYNLKIKIFGNQKWPIHQYLGTCDDSTSRDLFKSAVLCPNISEPHSTDLGWDVIERPFKVACAGGFCVSDKVAEAHKLFGDNLLFYENKEDLLGILDYFKKNEDKRQEQIEKLRRQVLLEHTYFDRIYDMFDGLGMESDMAKVLRVKGEHLKGVL